MRVLHVTPRYPPAIGGAERWCEGLARWQGAQGNDVRVLTLRAVSEDEVWGPGRLPPESVAVGAHDRVGGVSIRRCRLGRPAGRAISKLLGVMGLHALARPQSAELYGLLFAGARNADVVHVHGLPGPHAYVGWLAARAARRAVVLTPHFHAGDPWFEHRLVHWLLRRYDAVIVLTAAEAATLQDRGVAAARIVVASTAVDAPVAAPPSMPRDAVRAALGVPRDAPLLCFLGRKSMNKSLEVLLAALPRLATRPRPALVIAGPGTAWYRELIERERSDGVIDLPPLSEEAKASLLAAADLLVLPSQREAFGIVFLEAWAAGVPVLGADIPAVREAIGDAGWTFRPGDPDDLAVRIDALLAAPEAARELVARGRRRIAQLHTWAQVGPSVMRAYELARSLRRGRAPDIVRQLDG